MNNQEESLDYIMIIGTCNQEEPLDYTLIRYCNQEESLDYIMIIGTCNQEESLDYTLITGHVIKRSPFDYRSCNQDLSFVYIMR